MASSAKSIVTAIRLMKRALALLDDNDEDLAAARLQHAIDTARKAPVASSAEDIPEHLPPRGRRGKATVPGFLTSQNANGRA